MIIDNFPELVPEHKEIIRLLGKRKGTKTIDTHYLKLIEELKQNSQKLIEPKGIYGIFNKGDLPERTCFEETIKIALAVCTIGEKLPKRANNLIKDNELVKAIILDAIGSVTVEKVADHINQEINIEAEEIKLDFGRRYSPGYCSWETKEQKLIFDYIPAEKINVYLTTSFMMKPIKSISFAVNIGEEIGRSKWENRCKDCDQKDNCVFRFS
jgi:hypothetical protein